MLICSLLNGFRYSSRYTQTLLSSCECWANGVAEPVEMLV
jgi:hypothetical protein